MRVIPAVLTDKKDEFISMMQRAETYTDYVQIDIMDGVFVPSKSILASDLAGISTHISAELHLMIQSPETTLDDYLVPYVKQVVIHVEATEEINAIFKRLDEKGLRKGLAINPDTDPAVLDPYASTVDTVLFMTVYPGFYGRPMVPKVLEKAKIFKEQYPHINVGMDGGIKESNLDLIRKTGADFACVGSAIAMASNPAEAYQRLNEKVR